MLKTRCPSLNVLSPDINDHSELLKPHTSKHLPNGPFDLLAIAFRILKYFRLGIRVLRSFRPHFKVGPGEI